MWQQCYDPKGWRLLWLIHKPRLKVTLTQMCKTWNERVPDAVVATSSTAAAPSVMKRTDTRVVYSTEPLLLVIRIPPVKDILRLDIVNYRNWQFQAFPELYNCQRGHCQSLLFLHQFAWCSDKEQQKSLNNWHTQDQQNELTKGHRRNLRFHKAAFVTCARNSEASICHWGWTGDIPLQHSSKSWWNRLSRTKRVFRFRQADLWNIGHRCWPTSWNTPERHNRCSEVTFWSCAWQGRKNVNERPL